MTAVRRWQLAFIAVGVLVIGLGGLVLLLDVNPARYLGIALWFAGALVLHDAVLAPIVLGVHLLLRRVGRRVPLSVVLILQAALVVAALVTALVLPEILKQGIGSANPTILPLDYAGNLIRFQAGLALVTAAAIAVVLARGRREHVERPRRDDPDGG
ncbi:hypothetical protein [Arenivirga flava]|uniref:Uncharacterized protein n=1 Tax=Arenivirga flava TaxID=1930060 RepID=A0AA37UFG4_9MICO|nr:hypothetical protein [Arenivirga flava]GMA29319.1 hypothetical protein GCM10025874_25720 [Arenivirga flava]